MFEVVRDWNHATAVFVLKALSFLRATRRGAQRRALKALSASRAQKYFPESAFFAVVALTPHLRDAQTRITTSVSRDAQREITGACAVHDASRRTQQGGQ
jgi:hypothetical protein